MNTKVVCHPLSSIEDNCYIINQICKDFNIHYSTFVTNKCTEYFLSPKDDNTEDEEYNITNNMTQDDMCDIIESICENHEIDFSFEDKENCTIYTLSNTIVDDCEDKDEDTNEIEIELDDFEFLSIAKMAHERDCTFNEMINEIIEDYIFEVECDK
jgi:hypothetical protein